eukprot:CAMPEP_0175841770 /NCGR_PEP_ID=MMETSP0107_2-20121207/20117_1 /TAXON_ID=195067 ORGANISM="Goniomonas pacifica, Strain CCMP1869" /NCGR_SAMPLE_ID=MMETSP0107_2 /ASSEMBLY_ACC=CAM_ASM_000203 /LENGTH=39 /DNA_ID= /DNA_START= /DNA_END= /DNA_ORIENTATION=
MSRHIMSHHIMSTATACDEPECSDTGVQTCFGERDHHGG